MPNENSFKETEFQYCSQINQYYQLQGKLRIPVNKRDVIQILKNQFGVKGTQVTDFLQEIPEISLDDIYGNPKMLLVCDNWLNLETKVFFKNPNFSRSRVNIGYDSDYTEIPKFLDFLNTIFEDNQEIINYFQRVVGYCLSGYSEEQCAFFFIGSGANGKTTLLEVLRHVFGSYASSVNYNMIIKDNKLSHEEQVNLIGKRLAIINEYPNNNKINLSIFKQLTGNDTIGFEYRQKQIEFINKSKLIIVCNTFPHIEDFTNSFWRRCHILPFNKNITQKTRDLFMSETLKQEAQGILNWCIQGYNNWKKEGLNIPKELKDLRNKYRYEYDNVSEFIDRMCDKKMDAEIKSSELNKAYKSFCDENYYKAFPPNKVGTILKIKGFQPIKIDKQRGYKGIKIKEWSKENDKQ